MSQPRAAVTSSSTTNARVGTRVAQQATRSILTSPPVIAAVVGTGVAAAVFSQHVRAQSYSSNGAIVENIYNFALGSVAGAVGATFVYPIGRPSFGSVAIKLFLTRIRFF